MNAGKRLAMISAVAMALLLTAFFLFACSGFFSNGNKSVTPSFFGDEADINDSSDGADGEGADLTGDDPVTSNEPSASQNASNDGAPTSSGTDDEGTTLGGSGESSSGEGSFSQNGGDGEGSFSQNGGDGEDGSSQDLCLVTSIQAPGEWAVFVGTTQIGLATVSESGVFTTTAFSQTQIDLWTKTDEYGHSTYYLDFDLLTELREIRFRAELQAVQIDLTAEELALLTPQASPTDETQGDTSGNSGEGGETTQPEGSGEGTQNGEIQNGENQGGETTSGETQGNGQNDEEESIYLCAVCGRAVSGTSGHAETCSHYAVLPTGSEAHGFLSALPGVREDLSVTVIEDENEIYSFVLNYLSESDAALLKQTLLSCTVLFNQTNADGSEDIRAQKAIGAKVFTFVVRITSQNDVYKATVNLTGFAA